MNASDSAAALQGDLTALAIVGAAVAFVGVLVSTLLKDKAKDGSAGKSLNWKGHLTILLAAMALMIAVGSEVVKRLVDINEKRQKEAASALDQQWREAADRISKQILENTRSQLTESRQALEVTLKKFGEENRRLFKAELSLAEARDRILSPLAQPRLSLMLRVRCDPQSSDPLSVCGFVQDINDREREEDEQLRKDHDPTHWSKAIVEEIGDFRVDYCLFRAPHDADRFGAAREEKVACDMTSSADSQVLENSSRAMMRHEDEQVLTIMSEDRAKQALDLQFKGFDDQKLTLVRNRRIASLLDIQGGVIFLRISSLPVTIPSQEVLAVFLENENSESISVDGKFCKQVEIARRTLEGYLVRARETEPVFRCGVPKKAD